MSGVSKIEIHEAAKDLLQLMKEQKQLRQRSRIQALYLLKSGEATSISHVARILGYDRSTVQRWLLRYQPVGLSGLLTIPHHGGRQAAIPPWAQTKLKVRLEQPRGFASYGDIVTWLASECGICVNYWVVYDLVRRRWKAQLKSSRPSHVQQDVEAVEQFPERTAWALRKAVWVAPDLHLRYWVEDESRFGLKPIFRRRMTARGVPPVALHHWQFEWRWLYGFVEPLSGESFFWECSHLDHPCFGFVLEAFAKQYPDDRHMIQLDRSAV
ncbi:MAG: IS630 family transposase, partial [Leptolyngbya sp. SIO1D8]|nr:IS630 family transposase [Leptolyngbya sp. SIO1D8]